MALPPPSASELTTRYPVFASVDSSLLVLILAETLGAVDESWIEADRKPAMLAYAAHLLTAEGFGGETVEVDGQTLNLSVVKSVKVGDVTVGFAGGGSNASSGGFGSGSDLAFTSYGRRFLELLRRSHPAVLVA